ncbi:MAG: lipoate--protein ligase family protein [Clostridia bacterium]|nr:lipoate--protein ligase family protein [Clostridia bacterium]
MIYIPSTTTSAAENLAVEEYLLTRCTSGDFLMLWKSAPTVVIGKFQNAYGEVSVAETLRRGISLVRRNSGGGTVYHDEGNLNFTMVADRGENSPEYERFLTPVIAALRDLGIPAKMGDAFDITVDGYKVSGNAQSVVKNRVMHHGTLLFDADLTVLSEITGHASADVQSKAIQSNPSPVCNLRPYLKHDMDIAVFTDCMKTALCGENAEIRTFTDEETAEIERLRDTKYAAWEWNFAKSPAFTKHCGTFSVDVRNGIITAVHGEHPVENLTGIRMIPEDLSAVTDSETVNLLLR